MKKVLALCLIIVLWCVGGSVAAQGQTGADLAPTSTITATQNQGRIPNITDQKWNTVWSGSGDCSITITSETPMVSLYILWDQIPQNIQILDEKGNEIGVGAAGFLHEFIPLSAPTQTVVLQMKGTQVRIEQLYAFPVGQTPSWVQKWDSPLDKADMLLVSTHADDEHLWFGGAMPYYAGEKEKKVQVVYLMHHVMQRNHELLDGLWTVGIRNYPVIAPFEDRWADNLEAAKKIYDYEAVRSFQVEMIRRFQPEVVLSQDLKGEYGHGAHAMNAVSLKEAVENSGDASYFPSSADKYGVWTVKKEYIHLYDQNGTSEVIMDWSQPLNAFQGKTGFEMAVEGFNCHVSQRGYFEVADTGAPYDCHRFGLAYTTVGPDVEKNDFFENIPVEEKKPVEPLPDPQPVPEEAPSHGLPLWGWVLCAGAVAALAVGIWFTVRKKRG